MELYVIKFLIVQTEKDSLVHKLIEGSESTPFSLPELSESLSYHRALLPRDAEGLWDCLSVTVY